MTETEFRVKHSILIEYYQLIEMRLKSICAMLTANEEKGWFERLDDFEFDPIGILIRNIRTVQELESIAIFSPEDFAAIDDLREARNYWAHECFGGKHPVCFNKGIVKNQSHAQRINSDYKNAVEWDEKLANIIRSLHTRE